jgi:hypothetical protein
MKVTIEFDLDNHEDYYENRKEMLTAVKANDYRMAFNSVFEWVIREYNNPRIESSDYETAISKIREEVLENVEFYGLDLD